MSKLGDISEQRGPGCVLQMVTNGFTLVFGRVAAAAGIQLFTESGKGNVRGNVKVLGLLLSPSGRESAWLVSF